MSTDADRAARAWTEQAASADATADVEAARAHANTDAQVHEDAQAHVPAPAPQQPDYTSAPQDPHERAPEILRLLRPGAARG